MESDDWSDEDDYYDERVHEAMHHHDVDCPTCFVDQGDAGIRHEYGHRSHHGAHGHGRHGFHGHRDNMQGAHKEDVGEAIIGDRPIHHGEGHHGFGHETYRHIDFHDLFRKSSGHHHDYFETSDHHSRHEHEDEHEDEDEDEHDEEHDAEHEHDEVVEIGGHEHVHEHGHEEDEMDGILEENAQPTKAAKGKKGAQADPSIGF